MYFATRTRCEQCSQGIRVSSVVKVSVRFKLGLGSDLMTLWLCQLVTTLAELPPEHDSWRKSYLLCFSPLNRIVSVCINIGVFCVFSSRGRKPIWCVNAAFCILSSCCTWMIWNSAVTFESSIGWSLIKLAVEAIDDSSQPGQIYNRISYNLQ